MAVEHAATLRNMVDEFARVLEQRLGGAVAVNVDTVRGEDSDLRVNISATLHLTAVRRLEVKGYAIKHANNAAELVGEVIGDGMKDFEKTVNTASGAAATAWKEIVDGRG